MAIVQLFGSSRKRQAPLVPSAPQPRVAPPMLPDEPTFSQMASNFAEAMSEWRKAGFPVTSWELARARRGKCQVCPHWDGKARLGLGKCNHPQCGCTKLKFFLQTSRCPDGRWPLAAPEA